jgi:hypothetical protein
MSLVFDENGGKLNGTNNNIWCDVP